jgi:perosamine synthetase
MYKRMERRAGSIGVGGLVLTELEKRLVNEVLDSGQLTFGPMTQRLESQFAAAHGCRYALFMNSGTSALQLGLQALKTRFGWSDGDEVIIPAVTFVATANVVLHNAMKPVFADVEADTFNLDPRALEERITPRTRAIIPVHLLGLPAAMHPISNVARRHGLRIIEDSCEAMFAHYEGRPVGSLGDIGAFSTYPGHLLATGVGGFATTNDPNLADHLRSLMNHGRDQEWMPAAVQAATVDETQDHAALGAFSFPNLGHSARCTEMEAALGIGQLARADQMISRRRQIAAHFSSALEKYSDDLQLPACPPNRTHSYMVYGLVVRNKDKRGLMGHLHRRNIETRPMLPLVNQPLYRRLYGDRLEDQFPVAKKLNQSGFYIGCHPYLTDADLEFVIESFESYFER